MLVSTIICAYNYGRYVGEAIESVLSQGVTDHEVIVVDNGSTDETPAVLARYRDPRLRMIRVAENCGIGSGMNVGLEAARGDFLTFLDADDRWRPGKLRRELAIMESEPDIGLVFADLVRFNDAGYFPATQFSFTPELRLAPSVPTKCGTGHRLIGDCFETLIACPTSPCWTQTMMVRKALVRGLTFPSDRRRCSDLYYFLRMWPRVNAVYIDEPTAELRRHGENYTCDLALNYLDEYQTFLEFVSEAQLTDSQRAALHHRLGRTALGVGRVHLRLRHVMPALTSIIGAIRYPTARLKAICYLVAFPLIFKKAWGKSLE